MRRLTVLLGLFLLIGAAGIFSYRWVHEPARYARYNSGPSTSWRGVSEQRTGGHETRSSPSASRSGRGGLSGLRLFEIVVDLLNVIVGIVGIWLAVIGVRMQRAAERHLRTDA